MARSLALTGLAVQRLVTMAVAQSAAQLVQQIGAQDVDSGPHAVPRDLRVWLAGLRLLAGVPFGHLVTDSALLPAESIRFFYVDRGWTDALVEGALSVGTVTTADRSALSALYGTVRGEVDQAERLVRLPGVEPGDPVPSGQAGSISGFLLRSRMVSGWPGLHVRGYAVDNLALDHPIKDEDVDEDDATNATLHRLGLLRVERLAPAVLLVLFDGVPAVVHIEEPRAGVQFGVHQTPIADHVQAQVYAPGSGDRHPSGPAGTGRRAVPPGRAGRGAPRRLGPGADRQGHHARSDHGRRRVRDADAPVPVPGGVRGPHPVRRRGLAAWCPVHPDHRGEGPADPIRAEDRWRDGGLRPRPDDDGPDHSAVQRAGQDRLGRALARHLGRRACCASRVCWCRSTSRPSWWPTALPSRPSCCPVRSAPARRQTRARSTGQPRSRPETPGRPGCT